MEARKSGTPCFLCRSLLLSTTVLNDIEFCNCFFNTGTVSKRQCPKDKSARKLTDPTQLLVLRLAVDRPGIKLQEIQEELLNLLLVNIHISYIYADSYIRVGSQDKS